MRSSSETSFYPEVPGRKIPSESRKMTLREIYFIIICSRCQGAWSKFSFVANAIGAAKAQKAREEGTLRE